MRLFTYECELQDEWEEGDDELYLYNNDDLIAYYKITDEQRCSPFIGPRLR